MRSASWLALGWLGMNALVSCHSLRGPETLESGFYRVRRAASLGLPAKPLYVVDARDTLHLVVPATGQRRALPSADFTRLTFYRKEFDVDIFTIPFKIRSAREGVPAQLNSNFNAALYLGRRIDFFHIDQRAILPTLTQRVVRSRGFGYGIFLGMGSTPINEYVTGGNTLIQYDGLVLNAGMAAIYDARIFNVGLAAGFDHLVDGNRVNWIYQQRPWFGVLFGLNLN
ncbi:MAG: hypothetical protein H7Y12_08790 [Sphingobacteriaceae bacterium]|nr:hypothetical protein [Cytophagaceae bacterium]